MGRRGQLDTDDFNWLIMQAGQVPERWFRKVGPCPNDHNDPQYGPERDPDCPLCGGTNTLYREMEIPTSGASLGMIAFQQAQVGRANKSPFPEIEEGDVLADFQYEDYPLGFGDRLVIGAPYAVSQWEEHFRFDPDNPTQMLQYPPVVRLLDVADSTGLLGQENWPLLNEFGTALTWPDGIEPAGPFYVVKYEYQPTFYVVQGGIHRRIPAEDGSLFPYLAHLRLWRNRSTDVMEGQT